MLDELQKIVAHLEESLRVIKEQGEDEILRQPEFLDKMNQVAQSLIQVTRAMRELESTRALIEDRPRTEKSFSDLHTSGKEVRATRESRLRH